MSHSLNPLKMTPETLRHDTSQATGSLQRGNKHCLFRPRLCYSTLDTTFCFSLVKSRFHILLQCHTNVSLILCRLNVRVIYIHNSGSHLTENTLPLQLKSQSVEVYEYNRCTCCSSNQRNARRRNARASESMSVFTHTDAYIKVKFTPEQATKAQIWSRGTALLFL